MTEKIYLRVIQDDEKVKVVDQDGREVAFVSSISSEHRISELSTATITFEQSIGENKRMVSGFYPE